MIKRIITCLDVYDNIVVKGKKFKNIKYYSSPLILSKKYNLEGSDEIIYLNINKTKISIVSKIIKKISNLINIPISVGGNINNLKDVDILLNSGADRISLNSTMYYKKKILKKIVKKYGRQCLIASIDVKKNYVYINGGRKNTKINVKDWCKINEKLGAGEIILTSIEKDGLNKGFDIHLLNKINKIVSIPIIPSGGGGDYNTIFDLFLKTNLNSVLLASILHENKTKIKYIKNRLKANFEIR
ncbi:imidazole glycerol phosphate synthase subunit HisF [Candidatus Vidania fulgoroideorum]